MLIYLFLVSFLTRLAFLFFGHPTITNDEADYFINSYLLAKTGTDIFSKNFFLTSGILNSTSGVLVYIGSLAFLFLDKTVFGSRLPFAILNSFIPVLFYLIIEKLTKNKRLAILGFTVMNFSPWFSVLSSMSAFDSPISILFYLSAFYFLLNKSKSKLKYVLFVFLSFLSFNSYMGIKTSYLPLGFLALLAGEYYSKNRIDIKSVIRNFLFSLAIFSIFFTAAYLAPSSSFFKERLREKILFFNKEAVSKNVEYNRGISVGPPLIARLFHNKVTATAAGGFERYMLAFNPTNLFVKGDPNPLYGNNLVGLFYLFDAALLVLGLIVAFKTFEKKPLTLYVFLLLGLIAPIPNALMVDSPNIAVRAMLIMVPYSFSIGVGIYWLTEKIKNKKLSLVLPIAIYSLSFILFFAFFQTTIRVASSEQWHQPEKQLSDKLFVEAKNYKKVFVYSGEPKETTLLYDFYNVKDGPAIRKSLAPANGEYHIDNVVFKSGCPKGSLTQDNLYIIKRYACDMERVGKEITTPITQKPYLFAIDKSGTVYFRLEVLKEKP